MSDLGEELSLRLREVEEAGLLRVLHPVASPQGVEIETRGGRVLNFSSNDYLGLANHPALKVAAHAAIDRAGVGTGASRLISGDHEEHERLEGIIRSFKRVEAALSFSSGYAAALGTIPALVGDGDVVILDKLCHACLVDGARLSGAVIRVFPHNNVEKLESHLRWAREKYPASKVLVLAESVYSMDGDLAPLGAIVEAKERHGAWLMLDEAHGVGVVGEHGRGLADHLGLTNRVDVHMGTLGKALGASGAYIAGSRILREHLVNRARSFIFTTASSPVVAAAAGAAIELLQTADGEALRQRLMGNLACLAELRKLARPESAIVPIMLGAEEEAVRASKALLDLGLLVPAVRYPTVAKGAARLRLTVTAAHGRDQIERLASALATLA